MNSNVVSKKYGANNWAAVKGYLDATAAMPLAAPLNSGNSHV